MSHTPTSSEILDKARSILQSEGIQSDSAQDTDVLQNQILPALANTRDIQTPFYSFQPAGTSGAVKGTVLRKLKNVIVNVLERTVMRQQKYNELTYQAILELKAEIDDLKSRVR